MYVLRNEPVAVMFYRFESETVFVEVELKRAQRASVMDVGRNADAILGLFLWD